MQVEHDKFVTRPFCMTHENIVAPTSSQDLAASLAPLAPASPPPTHPPTSPDPFQDRSPRTEPRPRVDAESTPSLDHMVTRRGPPADQQESQSWESPSRQSPEPDQSRSFVAGSQSGLDPRERGPETSGAGPSGVGGENHLREGPHDQGLAESGAGPSVQQGVAAAGGELPRSRGQPPPHAPHGSASGGLSCLQPST